MPNVKPKPVSFCQNPECGKKYNPSHSWQKYCSRGCIIGNGRAHNICPCGVNTGSYQKKYCCLEHRERWGKKKAPTQMIIHTCLGCGQPFERPWFYPGKLKYCSNKCSHSQQKKVRDKFITDLPGGSRGLPFWLGSSLLGRLSPV